MNKSTAFDTSKLMVWLNDYFADKAKNIALALMKEYHAKAEQSPLETMFEVTYSIEGSEFDIGVLMNMACKLIYDNGYYVSPTITHKKLLNEGEADDDLEKHWEYTIHIVIFT
jgi:hypothetical protein